ncbi:hypothetical protein GDO81_005326 [Engystomops pustulosus]|uniref:Secreted protein n=1 Tax=Engystomops pustulosus TaxID=76066 RepID=A0AAV7CMG7_ENGPU|nr:hypothetical protein GDO81_005326 [Engystomops pustulosus]
MRAMQHLVSLVTLYILHSCLRAMFPILHQHSRNRRCMISSPPLLQSCSSWNTTPTQGMAGYPINFSGSTAGLLVLDVSFPQCLHYLWTSVLLHNKVALKQILIMEMAQL